jgi:hypothetical protein
VLVVEEELFLLLHPLLIRVELIWLLAAEFREIRLLRFDMHLVSRILLAKAIAEPGLRDRGIQAVT